MKVALKFLLALFVISPLTAEAIDRVALCTNCSSTSQFEAAAVAEVSGMRGEHNVLVVNPTTGNARHNFIIYTPPGTVPLGGADQPMLMSSESRWVEPGSAVALSPGRDGVWTKEQAEREVAAFGGQTTVMSSSLTTQERAEVNAIIELTRKDFVVVLDIDSGYFGSFSGRNKEATQLQLYQAMTEHNPAWAGNSLKAAMRKILGNKLARFFFGSEPQVCAIFNNGDSACFELIFYAPSVNSYIDGTAKNSSGVNVGGGGGGGGGGLVVNPNPLGYAGRGSTGSSGELWLFCATQGGVLIRCWTEVR